MLLLLSLALAADVVDGDTAPTWRILGGQGTATLLLNPSTGSPEAALDLLVLEAGAAVPTHTHPGSAELLYLVEGSVRVTIAGRVSTAGPGDAVYIPPDVEHSAVAETRVRAVQAYVGPGPEQRFTQSERVR